MLGVFHEMTELVNRTSKPLSLRFDGQDITLEPNYDAAGKLLKDVHNLVPTITVPYARSQNVRVGSEDPFDPSEFEVLVGVKAKKGAPQKDDISFLEQSDSLTRVDLREYLGDDPSIKDIRLAGRKNDVRAKRSEAQVPTAVDATSFRRS